MSAGSGHKYFGFISILYISGRFLLIIFIRRKPMRLKI